MTTADHIASEFLDGWTWETADGRHLDDVISERGGMRADRDRNESAVWRFADGSTIIISGDAWGIAKPATREIDGEAVEGWTDECSGEWFCAAR